LLRRQFDPSAVARRDSALRHGYIDATAGDIISGESHLRQDRQSADNGETSFVQHENLLWLGAS
jgi:hypothetical protein